MVVPSLVLIMVGEEERRRVVYYQLSFSLGHTHTLSHTQGEDGNM